MENVPKTITDVYNSVKTIFNEKEVTLDDKNKIIINEELIKERLKYEVASVIVQDIPFSHIRCLLKKDTLKK